MIYATILTLCFIGNTCDDYIIDTASTQDDCYTNLISDSQKMALAWSSRNLAVTSMREFLDDHKLYSVKVRSLTNYDYTCQAIADSDIP